MSTEDTFDIRVEDYALDDEQQALHTTIRNFSQRRVDPTRSRDVDSSGFDRSLWDEIAELGVIGIGVPEVSGGAGGGLVELCIVAHEFGRALAAVPFVETVTSSRLMAALPLADDALSEFFRDRALGTLGLHPTVSGVPQLVPAAGVAEFVLTLVDGELLLSRSSGRPVPQNIGGLPVAWWQMKKERGDVVLALGEEATRAHVAAVQCWKILTAALLVGMTEAVLDIGVAYSKDRQAFGVPIATFQAISHRIVDSAIAAQASQRLVWRAAWFADNEPEAVGELSSIAFYYASRAAQQAAMTTIHVQGGLGFTSESLAQLYFRRTKGLSLLSGDLRNELQTIANARFGPAIS